MLVESNEPVSREFDGDCTGRPLLGVGAGVGPCIDVIPGVTGLMVGPANALQVGPFEEAELLSVAKNADIPFPVERT
jgi:hypothetical protein